MRGDVGLGVGVSLGAGAERRRAAARRVGAEHVALGHGDVGLVEGGPVLDAVAERREAHVRQVAEVALDLGAEPRTVPVHQLLWDVVVGQRHEWLYSYVPCSKKSNVRVGIQNSHLDGAHNGYGSGDERAHCLKVWIV